MARGARRPRRQAVMRAQRVLRMRRAQRPGPANPLDAPTGKSARPGRRARRQRPPVIELQDIRKTFHLGEVPVHALRGVSLRVEHGEFVSIMGASGSGKTTLMNIIGCLDAASTGTYRLNGRDVRGLDDDMLANVRNRRIGFVFQTYNLIPRTRALANVELPLAYAGVPRATRRELAFAALEGVGLADRANHVPSELSGGQQQRVAIARALVTNPALILADEPTGNLDSVSGAEVLALFERLNDEGRTILLITHEADVAAHAPRMIRIRDGRIVSDEPTAVTEQVG